MDKTEYKIKEEHKQKLEIYLKQIDERINKRKKRNTLQK